MVSFLPPANHSQQTRFLSQPGHQRKAGTAFGWWLLHLFRSQDYMLVTEGTLSKL